MYLHQCVALAYISVKTLVYLHQCLSSIYHSPLANHRTLPKILAPKSVLPIVCAARLRRARQPADFVEIFIYYRLGQQA